MHFSIILALHIFSKTNQTHLSQILFRYMIDIEQTCSKILGIHMLYVIVKDKYKTAVSNICQSKIRNCFILFIIVAKYLTKT